MGQDKAQGGGGTGTVPDCAQSASPSAPQEGPPSRAAHLFIFARSSFMSTQFSL